MTTLHDLQHLRTAGKRGDLVEFTRDLAALGINWPAPPADEILFHLGNWDHIIRLYGHLDLCLIRWNIEVLSAADLASVKVPWDEGQEAIEERIGHLNFTVNQYRKSWGPDVWNGTWRMPPYLIDGALMKPPAIGPHLVEGHTRMGVLRGSLRRGDITPESTHRVWVASITADGG